jgi:hypothetical protein
MNVNGVNFSLTPARPGTTTHAGQALPPHHVDGSGLAPDATVIDALFMGAGGRRALRTFEEG